MDPVSRIIEKKERRSRLKLVIGVLILLMGISVLISKTQDMLPQNTKVVSESENALTTEVQSFISRQQRLASVKLEKMSWHKDAFDTVMMISFTLVNTNSFEIKDVEITCEGFGNSGTQIDRNVRTVYETVKAKGSKRMRKFNMGFIQSQVTKTSCAVTDFRP